MEENKCTCSEWARRIEKELYFDDKAVTFICAEHGQVTIDGRSVSIDCHHHVSSPLIHPRPGVTPRRFR